MFHTKVTQAYLILYMGSQICLGILNFSDLRKTVQYIYHALLAPAEVSEAVSVISTLIIL